MGALAWMVLGSGEGPSLEIEDLVTVASVEEEVGIEDDVASVQEEAAPELPPEPESEDLEEPSLVVERVETPAIRPAPSPRVVAPSSPVVPELIPEPVEPEVPVVEEVTVRLLSIPPTMAFEVGVEGQPGHYKGRTNAKLQLKPGLHRVVFTGPGEPYPFAIEVVPDDQDEGKNRWCYLEADGVHRAGSCR